MAAADAFGLIEQRPLVPIEDPKAEHPVGLGRVGRLQEPIALRDFARRVADALPYTELGVQVCGALTRRSARWRYCRARAIPCSMKCVPQASMCM